MTYWYATDEHAEQADDYIASWVRITRSVEAIDVDRTSIALEHVASATTGVCQQFRHAYAPSALIGAVVELSLIAAGMQDEDARLYRQPASLQDCKDDTIDRRGAQADFNVMFGALYFGVRDGTENVVGYDEWRRDVESLRR